MSFALPGLDKTKWATYTAVKEQLMKREAQGVMIQFTGRLRRRRCGLLPLTVLAILTLPSSAHASLFSGETLDAVANFLSWVVLFIAPVVGISVFWLVHILPEKIAEKKRHPQAKAIQTLCLLSLVFGGLLWPIAWLWAYTKPVLHKMAYGTDIDESHGHDEKQEQAELRDEERELASLRARVAELETELHGKPAAATRKA